MDRTKFYNKTVVDDTPELDYLYNTLSNFEFQYSPGYYRVEETDLLRPDLISFKNYGHVRYWWIICIVNKIEDVFADLEIGSLLTIPNELDIYNWYKKYKVR